MLVNGDEKSEDSSGKVEADLGSSREGSRTDSETISREAEAIQIDGLNPAQVKELRDKVKFIGEEKSSNPNAR